MATFEQIPRVNTLPSSNRKDLMVVSYQPSATQTDVRWLMQWDAGTSRWHFLGGPPLYSMEEADVSTASTSYVALGTGPSIALPVAGDYDIQIGARVQFNDATAAISYLSYAIGGTGASDSDAMLRRAIATGGDERSGAIHGHGDST